MELVSPSDFAPGVLLSPNPDSIGHALNSSSKIGLSYIVRVSLKDGAGDSFNDIGHCEALRVGVLKVEWKPVSVYLPQKDNSPCPKIVHGPLALDNIDAIRFLGPLCKIERVPFDAGLVSCRHTANVALLFEVKYWIKNNTPFYQKLSVSMSDPEPSDQEFESIPPDGILVSGLVNGDIALAPHETTTLGYSALAIKAGKASLPLLSVSSNRYQSWVIKDGHPNPRQLYVLP